MWNVCRLETGGRTGEEQAHQGTAHQVSAKIYLLKGKNVPWVDSASFVYHGGVPQSGAASATEALLRFQKAEGQKCLQRRLVGWSWS